MIGYLAGLPGEPRLGCDHKVFLQNIYSPVFYKMAATWQHGWDIILFFCYLYRSAADSHAGGWGYDPLRLLRWGIALRSGKECVWMLKKR